MFYDNNNNGIKDANEPLKKNIKLSLLNGRFSFTSNDGFYEIGADSLGSYILTVTPPRYYDAIPASVNYNFTTYDTLVIKDFALQPNTTVDELTIHITPINWAARPGFSFPYLISYENTGTTTLSPNIVFNYDNTRLTYDSSSDATVVNNGNNLSLSAGNIVPGQPGNFVAYFRVKPIVPPGDSIKTNAIISSNSYSSSDSNVAIVRGSFDPNDKQATPQLSPSQVVAGKYIDYTIRFQNTGNDTAFNIVISDTLSNLLQTNTLLVIASSHNCKTTVKGNIVFFEFLNILLPDSNVNELKSHGFVSFRIKPLSNIAVNTNIPNKAAIYFDYNSPVITNTAITQIKNPVLPVPLRLLSFAAVWQNNSTATISWNTANEINVRQYSIEQSLTGSSFTSIGAEPAKGRQYNTYNKSIMVGNNEAIYFRLKMIDMDGHFSYSPVAVLRHNNKEPFTILNNPASGSLNIALQDAGLRNTTARIIDGQGTVVASVLLNSTVQNIDIGKLAAGIYILQTEKGNKQFVAADN